MPTGWNAPRGPFSPGLCLGWNAPWQCRASQTAISPEILFNVCAHILNAIQQCCVVSCWKNFEYNRAFILRIKIDLGPCNAATRATATVIRWKVSGGLVTSLRTTNWTINRLNERANPSQPHKLVHCFAFARWLRGFWISKRAHICRWERSQNDPTFLVLVLFGPANTWKLVVIFRSSQALYALQLSG